MEASGTKNKLKKAVDKQLATEVKDAKKRKVGYILTKGEGIGKLVVKTNEKVAIHGSKADALEFMKEGGSVKLDQESLDDTAEGDYKTVELYRVKPARGEAFFWFVERI